MTGSIHTNSYGIKNKEIRGFIEPYYMNTHTHINTIKDTMGQFGPMVLKYMINFYNKNQTNVLVKD